MVSLVVRRNNSTWTGQQEKKKVVLVIYSCLLLAILRPSILIFCVFWAACNCFCFAILIQGTWGCDGALFYMWAAAEPDSGNAPGMWRMIVVICFLHLVMNNMYLMQRI